MQQCCCAADVDVLVAAVCKQRVLLLPFLALLAIQLPPYGLHRLVGQPGVGPHTIKQ